MRTGLEIRDRDQAGNRSPKDEACGAWSCCPWIQTPCGYWTAILSVCVGILLMLILIPLSYSYVEYDQMAFKKDTTSNQVDTSRVYHTGQYFWGLNFDTVTFPSLFQRVEETYFIFVTDGRELPLRITFHWRLRPNDLHRLFRSFGTNPGLQVRTRANSAIKNIAPSFTLNEWITSRETIPQALHQSLQFELGKIWIDVPREGFHLHEIEIPPEVKAEILNATVQLQTNLERENDQQAELVRKETERQAREITANATQVLAEGLAQAKRLRESARAERARIVSGADGVGIRSLFAGLNVTDPATKQRFFQFFTLIGVLAPTSTLSGIFT